MENKVEAYFGKPLPRWLKITALVFGVLMVSFGMGRLLTHGAVREVILQMVTGSLVIYISGFEKHLWLDSDGVTRTVAFWGYRKVRHIPWADVTDARIVANKGRRLYVLLHGREKIWPLTYLPAQKGALMEILSEHLDEGSIKIEH